MPIPKELAEEVRQFYAELIKQNKPVQTPWAVEGIMKAHMDIHGEDSEWYKRSTRANVWDAVNAYVRSVKASETDTESMEQMELFPGYERLQRAYAVERNGISTIVPVESLSDEEIDTKADSMDRMAEGLRLHAADLRRFKESRKAAV